MEHIIYLAVLTFKGLVVGVLAGWFARKVSSLAAGILLGLAVGAFFAYLVAAMPQPSGEHYYWQIILPGSVLGVIVGYATQRYGRRGYVATLTVWQVNRIIDRTGCGMDAADRGRLPR